MKYINFVTCMLIIGFTFVIPLPDGATDDRAGEITHQGMAVQSEKPANAAALNNQEGKSTDQNVEQEEKPALAPDMPVYKRPPRGAPAGRVGGGSRGTANVLPLLFVLAPDHIGLTAQEQPSLYWYLSESMSSRIEFTLIDDRAIQPLLRIHLSPPIQPGVQRIQLADHGVRLALGIPYEWFVALVPDPEHRSKDLIAGGALELIELPAALRVKLAQAGQASAPHRYAEAGLWYDALTAISELIDAAPMDSVLRTQRASLLDQVGLPEIAQYDRRHSPAN